MSIFDQILQAVPAEDRATFDKYPQLRASIDQMEVTNQQLAKVKQDWDNWTAQNWDRDAGMTRREKGLLDELTATGARLAELEAAGGNRGGVDDKTITDLRKEFDDKVNSLQSGSLAAIEGLNRFYRAASVRVLPHHQEFGENFDPDKLLAFMRDNKLNDPDVAYDKMVASRRAELATQRQKEVDEKHAQELAAAKEEGYKQKAQEVAMGPQGVLPTDQTGGIAGITSRVDAPAKISDELKAKLAEAKLGDGSIPQMGFDMYRRGELPTQ